MLCLSNEFRNVSISVFVSFLFFFIQIRIVVIVTDPSFICLIDIPGKEKTQDYRPGKRRIAGEGGCREGLVSPQTNQ